MGPLAAAVRGAGADLGAALNIDGDRIAFVTAEGVPLTEEHTLPLAAMSRLERRPEELLQVGFAGKHLFDGRDERLLRELERHIGELLVVSLGKYPLVLLLLSDEEVELILEVLVSGELLHPRVEFYRFDLGFYRYAENFECCAVFFLRHRRLPFFMPICLAERCRY